MNRPIKMGNRVEVELRPPTSQIGHASFPHPAPGFKK